MEHRFSDLLGELDEAILKLWTPQVTAGVATDRDNPDGVHTAYIDGTFGTCRVQALLSIPDAWTLRRIGRGSSPRRKP